MCCYLFIIILIYVPFLSTKKIWKWPKTAESHAEDTLHIVPSPTAGPLWRFSLVYLHSTYKSVSRSRLAQKQVNVLMASQWTPELAPRITVPFPVPMEELCQWKLAVTRLWELSFARSAAKFSRPHALSQLKTPLRRIRKTRSDLILNSKEFDISSQCGDA